MKRLTLNANPVPLAIADGAQVPDWILVVPAGAVKTLKGDFVCDGPAMEATIAAFLGLKRDLVIDYEHQTQTTVLNGQPAPAAGWIKELAARDVGLCARVEWTERAAGYIASREYRYLSPVIEVRPGDRRVVEFYSAALTNDPAIVGMNPIANRRNNEEEPMKDKLAELLGLKAEATDEEFIAAVQGLKEFQSGTVAVLELKAPTVSDVKGTVLALRQAPVGMVPAAEHEALKAQLARRDVEGLVDGAIAAGKVTPAQRDSMLELARTDGKAFETFVLKAPVVVPLGGRVAGRTDVGGGEGGMTEAERQVCHQLGVDEKAFKAQTGREV